MEDLATLEGKTLKELREIAKAFGIASEKLSKRTLIKIISGGSDAEESVPAEVTPQAEPTESTEQPQPKRRGRRPRSAEKVEITPAAEAVEPAAEVSSKTVAEEPAVKSEPKRRGRPKKAEKVVIAAEPEVETPSEASVEPIVEPVEEPVAEPEITKDDFTAEIVGEGVLELIPEGYGFLRSADYN